VAPDRRLNVREWGHGGDRRVVCWPGLNLPAHAHFDEAAPLLAERFALHVQVVEPPGWTSPPLAAEDDRPTTLARLGGTPLDRFAAAVPHAEVVTLESRHDLLAEALEETLQAVGQFVTSLPWSSA